VPHSWYSHLLQLSVHSLRNIIPDESLTTVQVVKPVMSPASARLLPRRNLATAVSNNFEDWCTNSHLHFSGGQTGHLSRECNQAGGGMGGQSGGMGGGSSSECYKVR